jgi:hypothetical protein
MTSSDLAASREGFVNNYNPSTLLCARSLVLVMYYVAEQIALLREGMGYGPKQAVKEDHEPSS